MNLDLYRSNSLDLHFGSALTEGSKPHTEAERESAGL
uniref:Uncharacterized protein n=1 Tax=Anguilla anguilla TaxID=7936 RepID=A0A0E9WAQ6_ANGAN